MNSPRDIQEKVVNCLSSVDSLAYLSFIGSSAYGTRVDSKISSDIDLLILTYEVESIGGVIKLVESATKDKVHIVQGWGFVQPNGPTIHLLIDSIQSFKDNRGHLFKNSALKYPQVVGENLTELIDIKPISANLLLYDLDGLIRYYNDLLFDINSINIWKCKNGTSECVNRNNKYCSKIAYYIYISTHISRNYLRVLGFNVDFIGLKNIYDLWVHNNLPSSEHILRTAEFKKLLKRNNDITEYTKQYRLQTIELIWSLIKKLEPTRPKLH